MPAIFATIEYLVDGCRPWRTGILSAFGLLLLAPVLACERGAQPQPAPRMQELVHNPLRFVTWNIQKCEGGRDAVIAELRKLDADVICLQEVIEPRGRASGPNQTREIATALGMNWYSQGGRLDDPRNQCLAILCRAPLSEQQSLWTAAERNYAVIAMTRWNGHALRIVCVHLAGTYKLDPGHVATTSRERALDWEALLGAAREWRTATVLGGDFNTLPGAPQLNAIAEAMIPAGDTGPTFPSQLPALKLDYVFLTRDLSTRSTSCVESQISDHRPLLVEFTENAAGELHVVAPTSQATTTAAQRTTPPEN